MVLLILELPYRTSNTFLHIYNVIVTIFIPYTSFFPNNQSINTSIL